MELRALCDGFVEKAARTTSTCLTMADHNRYSVAAWAACQMVVARSHAERVVVLFNDAVVAHHPCHFRRGRVIYDPWLYLSALLRRPGAFRSGVPFKDWDLLALLVQVCTKLKHHLDGDRQFAKVLGAVLDRALTAVRRHVPKRCKPALPAAIILRVLAPQRQPPVLPSLTTRDALRLRVELMADRGSDDSIRKVAWWNGMRFSMP